MLRSVRVTILLLAFASGASPWLNATNRADAALAWTFSQAPMAGKSTIKNEGADADLARRFSQTVRPFVTAYCAGCHSGKAPAASLDL